LKQFLSIAVIITLSSITSYGQNHLINNWSYHNSTDTNFYLSIGAVDRLLHSNKNMGSWIDREVTQGVNVFSADQRNRELLRFSYSTPDIEYGFVTTLRNRAAKIFPRESFNGIFHGSFIDGQLSLSDTYAVNSSVITHSLQLTKKSEKTILLLSLNASQLNSFRSTSLNGSIMNSAGVYQAQYLSQTVSYNDQLSYLGSPEEHLSSSVIWGDSVRITSLGTTPLIPSFSFHIIHQPTEFTKFQLFIDGIGPTSSIPMFVSNDFIRLDVSSGSINLFDVFTEENSLTLNSNVEFERQTSASVDSNIRIKALPLRIYSAYEVTVEPLISVGAVMGYENYGDYDYFIGTVYFKRIYNDNIALEAGLTSYFYSSYSPKTNLFLGANVKLSDKINLFASTSSGIALPYLQSELIPRTFSRVQLNMTLQYALL